VGLSNEALKAVPPEDADNFGDNVRVATCKIFSDMSGNLKTTVQATFGGDWPNDEATKVIGSISSLIGIGGLIHLENQTQFIKSTFKDGVWVGHRLMDPIVEKWNQMAKGYMVSLMTA